MKTSRILLVVLVFASGTLVAIHRARGNSADLRGTIIVDGRERTYLVHVPSSDSTGKTLPLVLALHGRLGNGEGQARLSHLDTVSDQRGFIVAYPDGLERSWADGRGATPSEKKGVNDVKFISELIDKLSHEYPVDSTRIYATGMSNGGFMSGRLACELSAKLAAVAAVAASISDNTAATCRPERPISILLMQGTADPLVPFAGGSLGKNGDRGTILSHGDAVKKWLVLDDCKSEPKKNHIPDKAGDGTSIDESIYSVCRDGVEVWNYVVVNGGHAWPGGMQYLGEHIIGKTSKNIDASEAIWQFFSTYSR